MYSVKCIKTGVQERRPTADYTLASDLKHNLILISNVVSNKSKLIAKNTVLKKIVHRSSVKVTE